jgi:transcriptional regulator with XRE-family HTH domain
MSNSSASTQVTDDWAGVAAVVNARMGALRMTQLDLATRSGVSPATIREIQHNHRPRRRYGRTLAALSEALQWPADYLDAVLAGRQPGGSPAENEPGEDAVLMELRGIREELEGIKQRLDVLETGGAPPVDVQ